MQVEFVEKLTLTKDYPLIILPFFKKGDRVFEAFSINELKPYYSSLLQSNDFKAKEGELHIIYPQEGVKRIALLGLGEKSTDSDQYRRSFAEAVKMLREKKHKEFLLVLTPFSKGTIEAIFDGILSMNYRFDNYRKEGHTLIEKITFVGKGSKTVFQKKEKIFSGVYLARDLVNENADLATPLFLADVAKAFEKSYDKIKTKILDKKAIEKEKMGLLLAVNRASPIEPRLIIVDYKGGKKGEKPLVLVGKGITYDTGGLSLKPTAGMLDMKADMGGSAAVLGTMEAIARLGIKMNVIGVIPSTENNIGGKSYKPGDVYRSMSGKTIEVNNTDAEGRLVLADAIEYAKKHLDPSCIVDIATLTGGIMVAIGDEVSGIFTDDVKLLKEFQKAATKSGEEIWHMPLHAAYKKQLKSEIADMVNSGGKNASAVTAALFLKEFVKKTPWVHLDIAGTAFYEKPRGIYPTQATGVGVKLLIEFIEEYAKR